MRHGGDVQRDDGADDPALLTEHHIGDGGTAEPLDEIDAEELALEQMLDGARHAVDGVADIVKKILRHRGGSRTPRVVRRGVDQGDEMYEFGRRRAEALPQRAPQYPLPEDRIRSDDC